MPSRKKKPLVLRKKIAKLLLRATADIDQNENLSPVFKTATEAIAYLQKQ